MKLFSFWRSLATYRVRIAMNLKGLKPDEIVEINLMKGQQREEAFRLGINLVMYALCLDYKTEQAHIDYILRTRRLPR